MAEEELPGAVKSGALLVIGALVGAGAAYFALPSRQSVPQAPPDPGGQVVEHDHAMHEHDSLHTGQGTLFEVPDTMPAPSVDFTLDADPHGGWTLQLAVQNFTFAPQNVGGAAVASEGHGHLYVNGDKIARLYGSWYHIASLPTGEVEIAVSLNTNDHQTLAVGGAQIVARHTVTIE